MSDCRGSSTASVAAPGLIPMVFVAGLGSGIQRPFATVIISSLVSSTNYLIPRRVRGACRSMKAGLFEGGGLIISGIDAHIRGSNQHACCKG